MKRRSREVVLSFRGAPPVEGEKSFYSSINKAIARGDNVDALKDIIYMLKYSMPKKVPTSYHKH